MNSGRQSVDPVPPNSMLRNYSSGGVGGGSSSSLGLPASSPGALQVHELHVCVICVRVQCKVAELHVYVICVRVQCKVAEHMHHPPLFQMLWHSTSVIYAEFLKHVMHCAMYMLWLCDQQTVSLGAACDRVASAIVPSNMSW